MKRVLLLGCLLVGLAVPVVVLLVVPPYPQPQWYHDFADQRCLLCVPNFWNVVSNLPFVVVGTLGVWELVRAVPLRGLQEQWERWLYLVFFLFIGMTGVGSAYYHWEPTNDRLLWDRLPLAVAFMALFGIIISERIDHRVGMWLFVPLVLLGAGSVVYWHLTEQWGQGDLRPYFLVQFYPLAIVPVILLLFPSRYTRTADLVGALAWYGGAKALELLDKVIYSQGQIVSGHTLKHLVAGCSAYFILHMLLWRRPVPVPELEAAPQPLPMSQES